MRDASQILTGFVLAVAIAAGGCGGSPVLANAPHPDPAVVAGAAAAIAGAATLADPNGQAKRVEANKPVNDTKPVTVKERVSPGALDRLDDKQHGSAASGSGLTPAPVDPDPADGVPFDQPQK